VRFFAKNSAKNIFSQNHFNPAGLVIDNTSPANASKKYEK
jgi:hypothetical protein